MKNKTKPSKIKAKGLSRNGKPEIFNSMFMAPVSEIVELVKGLKRRNSKDIYEILVIILKEIIPRMERPLLNIINCCIKQSTFPSELKNALVSPIFKKEDPAECANYRPISVLSVFSKVFEHMLKICLVDFMERQNILHR